MTALFASANGRGEKTSARLIPPQFVRPFVKSNKNDYRDAEAIAANPSTGLCVRPKPASSARSENSSSSAILLSAHWNLG
jgi:transposase